MFSLLFSPNMAGTKTAETMLLGLPGIKQNLIGLDTRKGLERQSDIAVQHLSIEINVEIDGSVRGAELIIVRQCVGISE